MAIPKKIIKAIQNIDFTDEFIREHYTTTVGHVPVCFLNDRPETWNDDETELFDWVTELHRKIITEAVAILEGRK